MIMISCSLIYTAMAGGHIFLCSIFFSLFGSYIVSWNVLSHLFLSSHGPFISGHEVTYLTEFQTTSLVIIERFTTLSCCQRASFPPELVIKYPNSVSSFQQLRLGLSGDVQLNPDPTALRSSYTMNNSKLSCALLNSLSPCNKIVEFQGLVYGNNLDQLRNETSTIWNKFNAGLQESFLEGIILSMSAFSQ